MKPSTPYHRIYDPRDFVDLLSELDLHPANGLECDAGRAITAELISPHVATPGTFRRVQARTGAAVFVQSHNGRVTGVTGMLPMTAQGLIEIEQHRFTSKNPPDDLLCAPGDPVFAMYAWGFAATTRKASAAVVMMTIKLRDAYPELPFFTRAVTPSGVKVICGRMGYVPFPGAPDDLIWNPVRIAQEHAA